MQSAAVVLGAEASSSLWQELEGLYILGFVVVPHAKRNQTCLSAISDDCKGRRQPLSRERSNWGKDNGVREAAPG